MSDFDEVSKLKSDLEVIKKELEFSKKQEETAKNGFLLVISKRGKILSQLAAAEDVCEKSEALLKNFDIQDDGELGSLLISNLNSSIARWKKFKS